MDIRWTPHSPRAGFATDAVAAGRPIAFIQEEGRWRSADSFRTYVDVVSAAAIGADLAKAGWGQQQALATAHVGTVLARALGFAHHACQGLASDRRGPVLAGRSGRAPEAGIRASAKPSTGKADGHAEEEVALPRCAAAAKASARGRIGGQPGGEQPMVGGKSRGRGREPVHGPRAGSSDRRTVRWRKGLREPVARSSSVPVARPRARPTPPEGSRSRHRGEQASSHRRPALASEGTRLVEGHSETAWSWPCCRRRVDRRGPRRILRA